MMNPLNILLRRTLFLPVVLLVIHFLGYGYAHIALQAQNVQNPWGTLGSSSVDFISSYLVYLQSVATLNFGVLPGGTESILSTVALATGRSLGLLLLSFFGSALIGFALGIAAVKTHTTFPGKWLTIFTTIGLATPGFFVGSLFITATLFYLFRFGQSAKVLLPLSGFGWDEHLILPLLALSIRPTAQIAQATAALLSGEFTKQYIVTARSIGHTWTTIRRNHALRNVLAPILASVSSSLRYLAAELILIEWIFSWPGLGRLLALTLIPPSTSTISGLGTQSIYFLHPELLAALLVVYAIIFFFIDTLFSAVRSSIDPRLRIQDRLDKYD